MADAGLPQRAIAAPFGVSLGKVNGALRSRRRGGVSPIGSDVAEVAAPAPAHVRVAQLVAAAGTRGLTIPQAQRRLGWTYGATSGALSRAERRGLVERPAAPRAARRVPPLPCDGDPVTLGEELDAIMRDLDRTGAAWEAAGYGYDTPEYEAREAVFARLREWNAKAASRNSG